MEAPHGRRPNPRGQGGRLREELLEAATRLLRSGGRDAELTLRGIAREAGVAAPSVYQQFADLDELMLALIHHHLADLATALGAERRRVADTPPRHQLRAIGHAYVAWGLANPGPYTVVFEGRVLRLLTREQEAAMLAGTGLFAVLTELVAAVVGPTEDAALAATAVWTSLHGLIVLRTAKPAFAWPPLDVHVDAVLTATWRPAGYPATPHHAAD